MSLDACRLLSGLDLSRSGTLVAAVSGGGDSLALLLMLEQFVRRHASPATLLAVTVDHGLRPEAAAEAAAVEALCRSIGVAHRTMAWRGRKPATGLIAAARAARHRLLAEAAAEAGGGTILTGHTMDDQAETVAMRSERRGEGAGLAGIAPATLFDDRVWVLRPLLGVRRAALREFLLRRGIAWSDDPTNDNPSYERARVRAGLADADIEALAARAGEAGRARTALAEAAAAFVDRFASRPAAGLFRLDPAFFRGADGAAAAVLALRMILAVAGGTPHLPDLDRARALFERIAKGSPMRATLSRAVVDARAGGVWIAREARGLAMLELAGEPAVWDGRWRVAARAEGRRLAVGSLGAGQAAGLASEVAAVPQHLVRAALSREPGLFDGGGFVAPLGVAAAVAHVAAVPVAAPFAGFLPAFDLALAAAARRLLGLPPLPVPPWNHHIDAGA